MLLTEKHAEAAEEIAISIAAGCFSSLNVDPTSSSRV